MRCCCLPLHQAVRPVRCRRARRRSSSMCGGSISPMMPSCCRLICVSCAAWSTARICRSTSRARCCRTTRIVELIRKAVTGRVISELQNLAEKDAEAFKKIWDAFGRVLKEGIYEDYERREALLALARFDTTTKGGELRTLKQYVADLRPNQTEIYYLDRRERRAARSPIRSSKRRAPAASKCCCSPTRSMRCGPRCRRISRASRSSR